jgi:CRP/FNR family transcriptional regulator, cyclic AMP receptor protein
VALEKLPVLSSSPLFDMLSDKELAAVADLSRPRRFAAGQTVFEEGALGDSVYVIVSGEVEILHQDASGRQWTLKVLSSPEFFGEMSLIDKEYRSATVRAKTDAELLHLSAENLTTFREQHRDGFTFLVMNIAKVLAARLREANARLVDHGAK